MYLLIIFVLIFVFTVYRALSKKFDYWEKRGVPHPKFSKIFGNLPESICLKKNLGQTYDEIYKDYSNLRYVGVYKLRQPALLIRDPELIRKVLITDFSYFHDNDAEVDKENDYLISKNPFFSKGMDWKINRGQLAPYLTSNKIKTIFPLMEMVCHHFIDHLDDPNVKNERINSKTFCEKYTMDVTALSVLGLEANSFTSVNSDFLSNIKKIVSPGTLMSIKFTLLRVMPITAKFLKIKYIPDDTANYFKNIIKNTLHFRQENSIVRNDFLHSMKELELKLGPNKFSVDEITAHCISFFIDGFETSSIVLSFALYELGANIEQQDKLRKEIERNDKIITFESISELSYLSKVLNESMRLHPPILFLTRRCTKAYQLPPADNCSKDVLIDPGTPIVIPLYSLHHDSKYFVNPEKFDPDRFSENCSINECTFLPFGGGPRICVGQKYGIAQIKTALVHLVLNYDIRVNAKTMSPLEIDPKHFFLSPKGGIWLDFIKRNKYQKNI